MYMYAARVGGRLIGVCTTPELADELARTIKEQTGKSTSIGMLPIIATRGEVAVRVINFINKANAYK